MKRYLKRIVFGIVVLVALIIVYVLTDGFGEKKHSENNGDFVAATFVRVVDGDTIVVELDGENIKVRLIGIDAPESVHSDESKNTEEGELATEYLNSLLKVGDALYLQYDEERTDVYGRTLAYVWINDEVDITSEADIEQYMLNAIMVKAGFARSAEYPPNTRYQNVFNSLED